MTYPQGPNYGGQYNPYQQQQGYQQQGYPPQPPPKKSNTPVIITVVAIVVIALGTLGITGFVAPGFFLSDDKESGEEGGGTGGPGGTGGTSGTGPEALAQQIIAGINSKDVAALQALKCPDADEDVDQTLAQLQMVQSATLGAVQQTDDTHATAQVSLVTTQGPITGNGELTKQGEKWCWSNVSTGDVGTTSTPSIPSADPNSVPGSSSGGTAESVMTDFLTKVNGSDVTGAKALICPSDTGVAGTVDDITTRGGNISYETPPGDSSSATLEGRLDGKEASGLLTATDEGGYCINYFSFY